MPAPLSMLAPKTMIPNGEGFGGHAKLEQCDVAYGLGGLPAGPTALLRAVRSMDHGQSNMRAAYLWAWQEALSLAVDRHWVPPKGKELLKTLSARAVDELVYPSLTQCPHCGGSGRVQPNQYNPGGDCKPCANTGRATPDDQAMAEAMGLSVSEWRAVWLPRYSVIANVLAGWVTDGDRHVSARLKEDC